jgi:nucleotide-binding universal stress UspA family protein
MKEKILVAFDDSENAMRAVEFVSKSFHPDHKVTLLSVIPDTAAICDMNSPELTPYFRSQQFSFCTLEDKKKELVTEAMERAKQTLLNAGFEEKDVALKVRPKDKGIARDIVREAAAGYGVVVLGRRGISGIKEFFMGSVSQKVLNLAKDVSIILVN